MSEAEPEPESENPRVPIEDRHPSLRWILDRFHLSLDALREMLVDVVPLVLKRERERIGSEALARVKALDANQQAQLKELLDAVDAEARTGDPSNIQPEQMPEWSASFAAIFENDRHALVSFVERLRKAMAGPDRSSILHNSLLTQAIGSFEVLLSGVLARHFIVHQTALETSEKQFSLAELRTFADIDDAIDDLIAKQVSKVMYGDLDDWRAWFKQSGKVDVADLALDWDAFSEAFQRRHVIMHNGGRVSRQYLSKVPASDANVGDRLDVDSCYVLDVLDQLDVVGTLLCVLAWGSWHRDDRDSSAGRLLNRSYELMLLERWRAVEKLTSIGSRLDCSAATREPIRVNGWNSRLELYGIDSIRSEVETWDTSVAVGRFRLVKLVLLGQLEEAASLALQLLESGDIEGGELKEWPVLRTLREYDGFEIPRKDA